MTDESELGQAEMMLVAQIVSEVQTVLPSLVEGEARTLICNGQFGIQLYKGKYVLSGFRHGMSTIKEKVVSDLLLKGITIS